MLEGVAYSARHLLEETEKAGGLSVTAVHASGGSSRSDLWCQIKADVLGRQVHRLRIIDSGVLGAALIGGVAADVFSDLRAAAEAAVAVERVFRPRAELRGLYDDLYRVYRESYRMLGPAYQQLAEWRERRRG